MEPTVYGRSCDNCRNKKLKCTRLIPTCTRCKKYGIDCTRNNPIKKRGPKPQPKSKSQRIDVDSNLRVVSQDYYNETLTNYRPILNLYNKSESVDKFKFKTTVSPLETSSHLQDPNKCENFELSKPDRFIFDIPIDIKTEKDVENI